MNELTQQPATNIILDTGAMANIVKFAEIMAGSGITIPPWLRGNVGDCMAVCMQAVRWGGMDPYLVAGKTYTIQGSGKLSYESQLIAAVINSSNKIEGRLHYEYGGNWEKLDGYEPKKLKGNNDKWYHVKGWPDAEEKDLWCRAGAIIKGENEITWGEKVYLRSIITRNSTNWVNAPKQQIAYTSSQRWCRLYAPDVILGVYTTDEMPNDYEPQERDITPQKSAIRKPEPKPEPVIEQQQEPVQAQQALDLIPLDDLGTMMLVCRTIEELDSVRVDVQKHDPLEHPEKLADIIEIYREKKAEILNRMNAENNK